MKCLLIVGLVKSAFMLFLERRIVSSGIRSCLLVEGKCDVHKVNGVILKKMNI